MDSSGDRCETQEFIAEVEVVKLRAGTKAKAFLAGDLSRNILQLLVLLVAAGSAGFVYLSLEKQEEGRKVNATFQFIKPLQEDVHTKALWELLEFTKCYEANKGDALSFMRYDEVATAERQETTSALLKGWWEHVENDDQPTYCSREGLPRRPGQLEEQLFTVYSRLEALASCGVMGLCDLDLIVKHLTEGECKERYARAWGMEFTALAKRTDKVNSLLESFDWQSMLAISNYILLSGWVAREWSGMSGNFARLIQRFEGGGM